MVADAVACLLARRPEDRPATAAAARAMLADAANGRDDVTLPPLPPPPSPPAGDRRASRRPARRIRTSTTTSRPRGAGADWP